MVVFEYDLVVFVDVEHGNGGEFGWDAASSRHGTRIDRVDQRLDDGVIGGVEVIGQRERAIAVAVVGVVAGRRHDPVVPADVAEIDVERMAAAVVAAALALVLLLGRPFTAHPRSPVVRIRH